MLQADTKEMYDAWISALQNGIGAAIQRIQSMDTDHTNKREPHVCTNFGDLTYSNKNGPSHDNNNKTKKRYKTFFLAQNCSEIFKC